MSERFLHDDMLLTTPTSRQLYHDVAAALPIVDVHTHLSPDDIESDRVWTTIDELWLSADHYKWRAMRLAGVPEELITGDVDPWDRFQAWAATMPRLVRNPLYVWTHLELRRVFDIDTVLDAGTAKEIWDETSRLLPSLSARQLLARFRVELVATTDDPGDPLDAHRRLAADTAAARMVPTFRPDQAHSLLADPTAWCSWVDRLGHTEGHAVSDLESLLACLTERARAVRRARLSSVRPRPRMRARSSSRSRARRQSRSRRARRASRDRRRAGSGDARGRVARGPARVRRRLRAAAPPRAAAQRLASADGPRRPRCRCRRHRRRASGTPGWPDSSATSSAPARCRGRCSTT